MVKIKQLWCSFLSVLLIRPQGKAASWWKRWRCSYHVTKSLAQQCSSTTYTSHSTLTYISTLVTSRLSTLCVSASSMPSADYRLLRSVYYCTSFQFSVACRATLCEPLKVPASSLPHSTTPFYIRRLFSVNLFTVLTYVIFVHSF